MNKTKLLGAVLLDHDPYLVVITETLLRHEVSDFKIFPPGYDILRRNRDNRGRGCLAYKAVLDV